MGVFFSEDYSYKQQKTIDFCMVCFNKDNIKIPINKHGFEGKWKDLNKYFEIYCDCNKGHKISYICNDYSEYIKISEKISKLENIYDLKNENLKLKERINELERKNQNIEQPIIAEVVFD